MRFAWDEAKRRENLRKHGIDFIGIEAVFAGLTVTMLDDRFDYGEKRFTTLGVLEDRVVVVAHTERRSVIRVISVRKASKREQQRYFTAIAD
jgi:hypothetical protein